MRLKNGLHGLFGPLGRDSNHSLARQGHELDSVHGQGCWLGSHPVASAHGHAVQQDLDAGCAQPCSPSSPSDPRWSSPADPPVTLCQPVEVAT